MPQVTVSTPGSPHQMQFDKVHDSQSTAYVLLSVNLDHLFCSKCFHHWQTANMWASRPCLSFSLLLFTGPSLEEYSCKLRHSRIECQWQTTEYEPPHALNVTTHYLPVLHISCKCLFHASQLSSRTVSAVSGILRSGSLIKIKYDNAGWYLGWSNPSRSVAKPLPFGYSNSNDFQLTLTIRCFFWTIQ